MPKKLVFGTPPAPPVAAKMPTSVNMNLRPHGASANAFQTSPAEVAARKIDLNAAPTAKVLPTKPRSVNLGGPQVSNLDALVEAAKKINPHATADIKFVPRLRLAAGLTPMQWMNWSDDRLAALSVAANSQVKVNTAFNDLQVAKWCDDARMHASKKPSWMDAFKPEITPEFYDAQLQRVRAELTTLAQTALASKEALSPKLLDLQQDSLIFQVVSANLTDPNHSAIAHSKLTSLVNGVQLGLQAQAGIDTTIANIMNSIQIIDQVRHNVIPAWRLSQSTR